MQYTSAEANKLLRKLNNEKAALEAREEKRRYFNAAVGEDVESLRPEYDYAATQKAIVELDGKIRRLKHAINRFNLEHEVPGFNMTVDQMLLYLPQMSARLRRLYEMKDRLPRERVEHFSYGSSNSNIIDYVYVNYDLKRVAEDYDALTDEIARAQTALDLLNAQETLEFDL